MTKKNTKIHRPLGCVTVFFSRISPWQVFKTEANGRGYVTHLLPTIPHSLFTLPPTPSLYTPVTLFPMDSEVIERLQSISLIETEGKTIILNPSRRTQTLDDCSLSLVGRFLTTRDVNHRAKKNLLRSAWKLSNDLRGNSMEEEMAITGVGEKRSLHTHSEESAKRETKWWDCTLVEE